MDTAAVILGSDKERTVLAVLAAEAGRPVSIEKLIFRLWDDAPPDHARDGVHAYISRLRKRLRTAGTDGPRIDGRAHTYVLRCAAESVDWTHFQNLVAARPLHDDAAAARTLQQAEALWRGEPLAGLAGTWAEGARQAMLEQRQRAAVLRLTAVLRLGDFAGTVSELSSLARERPTDETVQSLLMLAYHGSSRSTEALHVYQRLRQTLMVQYGTHPGTEVARLHHGILNQIPAASLLHTPAAAATAPGPTTTTITPRNLPHQPPLIGRTSELRQLTEQLSTADAAQVISLETVTGMAGVGKTALAVHTAHQVTSRYPDAQLYLNLRAHTPGQVPLTPTEALAALLRLLGAASRQITADLDEQTSLWRHMLAERKVVIVLDDAADAAQIVPLIPDRTSSLVIVTSRRHLPGIPHAQNIPVDVLPTADAMALFRSFAGHQRTANDTDVRAIVRLCDHLPLAIEVVATRFKARTSWTLSTVADRLSRQTERLAELHTSAKSVRRAFDLSYQTLPPEQRRAFRLLSLYPGDDFTAALAAAALDLPRTQTERILEDLISWHLISEPVPDRYQYHDLLREYARSLTTADHERAPALHRMIDHYHQATATADRCVYPRRLRPTGRTLPQPSSQAFADATQAKSWLAAERGNLLAAIDSAETDTDRALAAQLGYSLAGFLEADCHWQDAAHVLQRSASHWRQHPPSDADGHSLALLALCAVQINTGVYAEAAEGLQKVLDYARSTGRLHLEAEALRIEGMRLWHLGDHRSALAEFRSCMLIHRERKDRWNQARVTSNIAVVNLFLQRHDEAMEYFRIALEEFEGTGEELLSARVLNNLGDLHFRKGELEESRRSFEDSLALLTQVGNRFDQATARSGLADTLSAIGDPAAALELYEQALQEFQSLGDGKSCAQTLIGFAEAHHALGDIDDAISRQTAALQFATGIGSLPLIAETHLRLGNYHRTREALDQATLHWEAATHAAAQAHDIERVTAAQEALLHLRATGRSRSGPQLAAPHPALAPLYPDEIDAVRKKLLKSAQTLRTTGDR